MSDPTHNIILMWWGLLANIPTGWKICDGNNNTPNLKNYFLVGAGDTYAVDNSGAGGSHDHTFTSFDHFHFMWIGSGVAAGADFHNRLTFAAASGTTDPETALPPYKAVYFIKKD